MMSRKLILSIGGAVAIALATISPAIATPQLYHGTVTKISDGDTIKANFGSKQATIRLACIDAPEKKQSWGKQSTDKLKQLLPTGQKIKLRLVNIDRYKRIVGEIYLNNQSINLTYRLNK